MFFSDFENMKSPSSIPFIWARQKTTGKTLSSTFSRFSILVKLVKKQACLSDSFHSFIWNNTKKWYNPKNEQHAKHSIFFTRVQHMSRLWTKHICIKSPLKHLPVVSTLTFSVLTPKFILLPLVSHFSILQKLCHLLCHRLRVITILQVMLPMSLLVSCFCSKTVITWVSFYVDPSYESSLS